MSKEVILNLFDDPKLCEREYVSVGESVYASGRAEEFGLTKNRKYEILDTNGYELIKISILATTNICKEE